MITRSLMTGLLASLMMVSSLWALDDDFDNGVSRARSLTGAEQVQQVEALIAHVSKSNDAATQTAREAVAVVGATRMASLKAEGAEIMTRAGLVRVRLNRLKREVKKTGDMSALINSLVEVAGTSASIVPDSDALVARANSVSPADRAKAAQEERERAQREAAAAAAAAQEVNAAEAQQAAAMKEQQRKAAAANAERTMKAGEASRSNTNPEYLDVSSENFWKNEYATDVEQVAEITTNVGTMVLEFWPDVAPGHVKNFVDLAKKGFYDGVIFHRVIPGFMIQGGCPNGNGMGGPGYTIAAEFNDRLHERGVLSMARTPDPNSAGSQFFVCHARAQNLDGQYTAFGTLLAGFEALDTIANSEKNGSDKPNEAKTMMKVVIRDRTDADVAEDR